MGIGIPAKVILAVLWSLHRCYLERFIDFLFSLSGAGYVRVDLVGLRLHLFMTHVIISTNLTEKLDFATLSL